MQEFNHRRQQHLESEEKDQVRHQHKMQQPQHLTQAHNPQHTNYGNAILDTTSTIRAPSPAMRETSPEMAPVLLPQVETMSIESGHSSRSYIPRQEESLNLNEGISSSSSRRSEDEIEKHNEMESSNVDSAPAQWSPILHSSTRGHETQTAQFTLPAEGSSGRDLNSEASFPEVVAVQSIVDASLHASLIHDAASATAHTPPSSIKSEAAPEVSDVAILRDVRDDQMHGTSNCHNFTGSTSSPLENQSDPVQQPAVTEITAPYENDLLDCNDQANNDAAGRGSGKNEGTEIVGAKAAVANSSPRTNPSFSVKERAAQVIHACVRVVICRFISCFALLCLPSISALWM